MTKKLNKEKYIEITFWLFSIIMLLINFYLGLNKKLWLDEIASIQYTNIDNLTQIFTNLYYGTDINPPLFYSIFYFIRNIFQDNILTYRIFIFLIGILSMILLLKIFKKFLIYKNFYLVLALLTITSFFSQYLIMEIRSYGLFFLLFLIFIYYWLSIRVDNQTVKKDLVIISIVSILLIYTHYYAIPYVLLLLLILALKEKKIIFWLPLLIVLIAFVPWIKVITNQLIVFHGKYWQPIPSLKQLLYLPFFYFGKGIIFILVIPLIIIITELIKKHEIIKIKNASVLKNFFWVIFLIPIIDFIFSSFDLLVFVERYFIPTFIGFFFIIGILVQKVITTNYMKTIFFVLILLLGAYRIWKFNNNIQSNNRKLETYLNYENKEIPIVCESPHLFYPLNYYSKKKSFWYVIDSTAATVQGNVSNSIFDYYGNKKMKVYYNIKNIIEWERFKSKYKEFLIIDEPGRLLFEYYIKDAKSYSVKNVIDNLFLVSIKIPTY